MNFTIDNVIGWIKDYRLRHQYDAIIAVLIKSTPSSHTATMRDFISTNIDDLCQVIQFFVDLDPVPHLKIAIHIICQCIPSYLLQGCLRSLADEKLRKYRPAIIPVQPPLESNPNYLVITPKWVSYANVICKILRYCKQPECRCLLSALPGCTMCSQAWFRCLINYPHGTLGATQLELLMAHRGVYDLHYGEENKTSTTRMMMDLSCVGSKLGKGTIECELVAILSHSTHSLIGIHLVVMPIEKCTFQGITLVGPYLFELVEGVGLQFIIVSCLRHRPDSKIGFSLDFETPVKSAVREILLPRMDLVSALWGVVLDFLY